MTKIKIEIKWAIVFLLMGFAWMAMERLAGLHDEHIEWHPIFTNLIAIPAILIYVLALRDKRKNYYMGQMTYGQGFVSGLIITGILTLLAPISQFITSTLITPHYFDNVINYVLEHKLMNEQEAKEMFNLKAYLIQSTIGTAIMGVFTTSIVAIFFMRKSKKIWKSESSV